jgi:Sec23/Sec24 zinc finger.
MSSNSPVEIQKDKWVCPLCNHKNEEIKGEYSRKEVQCLKCYKKFEVNNL